MSQNNKERSQPGGRFFHKLLLSCRANSKTVLHQWVDFSSLPTDSVSVELSLITLHSVPEITPNGVITS